MGAGSVPSPTDLMSTPCLLSVFQVDPSGPTVSSCLGQDGRGYRWWRSPDSWTSHNVKLLLGFPTLPFCFSFIIIIIIIFLNIKPSRLLKSRRLHSGQAPFYCLGFCFVLFVRTLNVGTAYTCIHRSSVNFLGRKQFWFYLSCSVSFVHISQLRSSIPLPRELLSTQSLVSLLQRDTKI